MMIELSRRYVLKDFYLLTPNFMHQIHLRDEC
jgi:hypothetical protein